MIKTITAITAGLCSLMLGGAELLPEKQWNCLPVEGGKGSMVKLPDGSYEITKANDKGVVFFYCGKNEPAVAPGKTYRVTVDYRTSSDSLAGYIMLSMPGAKRTPFPVSKPAPACPDFKTAVLDFTAQQGESKVRIHFCLKGEGKAVVRSVDMQEIRQPDNLLERASFSWEIRKNENSAGEMKRNGAVYEVFKTNRSGYLAFVPGRDIPVVPGKHYLVQIESTKLSPDVTTSMMLSMPGGKRTPYPVVRSREGQGKTEMLSYYFTARPDEKLLRPHLIIRGTGKVSVSKVIVKELSGEELWKREEAGKAAFLSFDSGRLKEFWMPYHALKLFETAACTEIEAGDGGGFECRSLNWKAADVKIVEARFKVFEEGGYLRLDFTAVDRGKQYSSYLAASSLPDGEWHDLLFPVGEDPAWRGTVTSIRLSWIGKKCRMALSGLNGLQEVNNIPFAVQQASEKKISLDSIRPRGEYLLEWKNGKNPGMELCFFDRNRKVSAKQILQKGKESVRFKAPETAVAAELRIAGKAPGYPRLFLERLAHLNAPPAYWRGSWIWCRNGFGPNNTNVWFERKFRLKQAPEEAVFVAAGDDLYEVFVNGKKAGGGSDWRVPGRFDVAKDLKAGENRIVVRVHNVQAWGGLLCELYVMENGRAVYFPSNGEWMCHVGGDRMPQAFLTPVMLLGTPPVAPWGTRVNYAYAGPVGEIEILKSGEERFTARIIKAPAIDADQLYFRVVSADGREKRIQGKIKPATSEWKPGRTLEVSYSLPVEYGTSAKAYLDADYIRVKGSHDAGSLRFSEEKKSVPLVKASIAGAGKRAWFLIDGRKYSPVYYDLPGTFGMNPASRDFLVRNAVAAGAEVIRFGIGMDQFWQEEGRFDFSGLDRAMEVLTLNAPEMRVILTVKCGMPSWWMKKNPDDVTKYYGGQPIHEQKDRQALASKKYLQDAAAGLRALIGHIRQSSYADRVFGMGISEGWNSEWFWSYEDGNNRPARSGFSKADFATFRSYLREKYQTDAALASAWKRPGLTFDTITMPSPREQDAGSVLALLDPAEDMAKIDWFEFRNRAVSEAIIALCKVVKEETGGRWLCGAYYGYLIAFSNIFNRLQTVGHLGIEAVARSPYVDYVWGPSFYTWRYPGMSDSPMQAAESFTSHGKLVIVEQDLRTFSENSQYESRNGKLNTVEQSIGAMNRAFGMTLARGIGMHWMEMYESWFREKVLLELMAEQQKIYRSLPPVQGTTPVEVCIVSDQKSAFYAKHNAGDGAHRALIGELMRRFNEAGFPFRHVLLADLLQHELIPPQKLYIMTNLLMLTKEERNTLKKRLEREKAAVVWLYAPGVFYPENGPSAGNISDLLGIGMKMVAKWMAPVMELKDGWGSNTVSNPNVSGPWFFPESGFKDVIGTVGGKTPALVSWEKNGVRNYFTSLMYLPPQVIRSIAGRAGVHLYNRECGDPLWIGNDVVFLHAKTGGMKSIQLPPGMKMRAISGPFQGEFRSGEFWNAEAGQTYGFLVFRQ